MFISGIVKKLGTLFVYEKINKHYFIQFQSLINN